MAISQTMSNNPADWLSQSYQTDFSHITQIETPPTTVAAASAARNINLSPDHGRVAKPIRRRSRASRRTPTTLLNTDATNFRAMVQRFTGGPAATFAARSQIPNGGGATLNFMEHVNAAAARPAAGGFYVPYPNQLQQQQQQQQHMFMMDVAAMHGGGGGGGPSSQAAARPPGSDGNENRDYDTYML